ncbi:MAG: hypothetical protein RLZZ387_898 [Chloroflexota bacterium]
MTAYTPPETERHTWRDQRLGAALKAHRSAVKDDPDAQRTLDRLIERLRYLDRCISLWDTHHAKQAAAALDAGQHERAAGLAWLVWDADTRGALLAQVRMEGAAEEAAQRVELNRELGRVTVEEGAL